MVVVVSRGTAVPISRQGLESRFYDIGRKETEWYIHKWMKSRGASLQWLDWELAWMKPGPKWRKKVFIKRGNKWFSFPVCSSFPKCNHT